MRGKWEIRKIEHAPFKVSEEVQKQLIAELGEILYLKISQLQNVKANSTCSTPRKGERAGA